MSRLYRCGDTSIAQCGYTWACWFMTLASFCLDFQPMFAQSDWLIGQLTVRETLCCAKLMGLKLKDTLDIQAVEVGRRDVWFGRALLPYAIERATRRDILLLRAPVWWNRSSCCFPFNLNIPLKQFLPLFVQRAHAILRLAENASEGSFSRWMCTWAHYILYVIIFIIKKKQTYFSALDYIIPVLYFFFPFNFYYYMKKKNCWTTAE